ncbi:hypothetical protein SLEP1_g31320 [Rubroshorea leprosula]|uniref:Phytocyanin domain-containing protein n=1 Tax=Rubroshorea leprosula TaxID=152421 RepID=A0AAV5KAC4_9ROSI|nr:hypothetical protein SLEP1_g31320 [Rubroshorea leprosula]
MSMLLRMTGLVARAMFMQLTMGANYTVGGAIFQYTPNYDVLEVSKSDYDNCKASNALQTYTDGNTVIPLPSPGKRYFICGTIGHCLQGKKMEVDTMASSATPQPVASPVATPVPVSTTKASTLSPTESPIPIDAVIPPSPSESPSISPSLSPDASVIEFPASFPSPGGLQWPTPTPPSSANKDSFQTCLVWEFGLVAMMF